MFNGMFRTSLKLVQPSIFNVAKLISPQNMLGHYNKIMSNHILHQQFEVSPTVVTVDKSQMLDLSSVVGEEPKLRMGLATKAGLALPYFPISHSAVCFHEKSLDKFVVLGRQSPIGLSINNWHLTTKIDDEKSYLSDGYKFNANMTDAMFSLDEVKQMLNESNNKINEAQPCDMIGSNCYSSSVYMMAHGLELITERSERPSLDYVVSIIRVLTSTAQDNLSIGVLNNDVITAKVANSLTSAKNFIKDEVTAEHGSSFSLLKYIDEHIESLESNSDYKNNSI